ncbi:MAG TPA: (deoxy)nucleoside triphosphate pyrophosphohydrolase [Vicinamibacterales bacterium]|nr:(deoxy)nucleoside triphosphate pyrophosphohydrolase [Vicinamibacterales bacterium]
MTTAPPIVVTAAVVERAGALLVTRRLEGTHLAGHWEFPGGKCEPGEEPRACLAREVREELGVGADVGDEIHRTFYAYGERRLELVFFRCSLDGEPQPLLGQEIRWVSRADLPSLAFPPADAELIQLLQREDDDQPR